MNVDNAVDNAKIAVSFLAPGLTILGIHVQEWTYILSGIVSILLIIEKFPIVIRIFSRFVQWIKKVLRK